MNKLDSQIFDHICYYLSVYHLGNDYNLSTIDLCHQKELLLQRARIFFVCSMLSSDTMVE